MRQEQDGSLEMSADVTDPTATRPTGNSNAMCVQTVHSFSCNSRRYNLRYQGRGCDLPITRPHLHKYQPGHRQTTGQPLGRSVWLPLSLAQRTERAVFTPRFLLQGRSVNGRPRISLLTMSSEAVCSSCSMSPAKLLRCSGCQSAWYCNSTCQRAHWSSHKAECKRLKKEKIEANTRASAAELVEADAMRIVVQTDRIVITRCADPDDSVYMQVMAQPAIGDWIQANQMECWCESAGTFSPSQSIFVVATFTASQIEALPQPRSEIELSDHSRERGVLESEPINAFGHRLLVTASPALGQVSFGLRELARDPAPPLDAVQGTAMIASCFLLSGERAERLVLPPPMSSGFHAGAQRSNGDMKVWCGVGESVTSITASDLKALPRVSQAALRASPVGPQAGPPPPSVSNEDVIAIGMLLESCGTTSNVDEFEAMSIQAFLHEPHTRQQPEAAVPPFARRLVVDPNAVASVQARSDSATLVSWMAKGKGM